MGGWVGRQVGGWVGIGEEGRGGTGGGRGTFPNT